MPLVSDDAVVLQAFAYGETSKVLRLLTRTHGVRSAIAKGARRPKSRFAAVLEPFAEGTVTLYLKEGRDLQTLGSFELTRSRQGLGGDLFRFGGASLLTELVLRTASEASEPALFEQFRRAPGRRSGERGARGDLGVDRDAGLRAGDQRLHRLRPRIRSGRGEHLRLRRRRDAVSGV